ncbi:hypothetical protein VOI54_07140 [Tamlana sp. 2201CG12-4]|nr:hypothetical protein [Tamlana sp. 2201CG12-4]MEC3906788.1 hypothetical protein [Tamlana sp. 2201CG12-4]
MKTIKDILRKQFIVDWKNIKDIALDESKRVYSLHDYNEDSILFI